MEYFTAPGSIVRKIWGKSDTILFIFAGAAAEFALNKAVDWLYFTGKLPADPIGRLFSTVTYAKQIVFSELNSANAAIDRIAAIHGAVEKSRGATIPDWAYRDVLYMLIHYSIAAFEVLERKLTEDEKQEVFDVFYRVGKRMHLQALPSNYSEWKEDRWRHLQNNLEKGALSIDLFKQYEKHLGKTRYWFLIEAQKTVVPDRVSELLEMSKHSFINKMMPLYKLSRKIGMDGLIKSLLLPRAYKQQIDDLNMS